MKTETKLRGTIKGQETKAWKKLMEEAPKLQVGLNLDVQFQEVEWKGRTGKFDKVWGLFEDEKDKRLDRNNLYDLFMEDMRKFRKEHKEPELYNKKGKSMYIW